jgi:inosose dehydratase
VSNVSSPPEGIKIGIASVNWWNNFIPLPDSCKPTSDDVFREANAAGYAGIELGDALPTTARELTPLTQKYGLPIVAGFLPTFLLSQPYADQEKAFRDFAQLLVALGATILFVAEGTFTVALSLAQPLFPYSLPRLEPAQWQTLSQGLAKFHQIAVDHGLTFAYHPMVSTIIQEEDQIDHLLDSYPALPLVLDTGHLALAGIEPIRLLDRYLDRIVHVHLKNIRPDVVRRVQSEPFCWSWTVIEGAFTVPGDGGLDFQPIVDRLKSAGYQGWVVVEAEQDRYVANPYLYAKLARDYLKEAAGW